MEGEKLLQLRFPLLFDASASAHNNASLSLRKKKATIAKQPHCKGQSSLPLISTRISLPLFLSPLHCRAIATADKALHASGETSVMAPSPYITSWFPASPPCSTSTSFTFSIFEQIHPSLQ